MPVMRRKRERREVGPGREDTPRWAVMCSRDSSDQITRDVGVWEGGLRKVRRMTVRGIGACGILREVQLTNILASARLDLWQNMGVREKRERGL